MPSPYIRTINSPTGLVYINPNSGINTQIYPLGGLTSSGLWVPLLLNPDGTLVSEGFGGNPSFEDVIETTTPGVVQTLISSTVPAGTTRNLSQVFVITRVTGAFQVIAGGEIIGSGRTGPAGTGPMTWNPARPLATGASYELIFLSRPGSPPQDVEAYIQASDTSA